MRFLLSSNTSYIEKYKALLSTYKFTLSFTLCVCNIHAHGRHYIHRNTTRMLHCLCRVSTKEYNKSHMSSDEGWEEVYKDTNDIEIILKEKVKRRDIKIQILATMMEIFRELYKPLDVPHIDEFIDYNVINRLYQIVQDIEIVNDTIRNIKYFQLLRYKSIHSRIYFVINNNKVQSFLEIYVNNTIIQHTKKYNGVVFYIDSCMNVCDYSWYFSTSIKYYDIFVDIVNMFNKHVKKMDMHRNDVYEGDVDMRIASKSTNSIKGTVRKVSNMSCASTVLQYNTCESDNTVSSIDACTTMGLAQPTDTTSTICSASPNSTCLSKNSMFVDNSAACYTEFAKLDEKRQKELPSSVHKYKYHPIYVLKSMLPYNQTIIDSGKVAGFYKGEPVHYKKNIKSLKSRKYWYRNGKEPFCNPAKIHNDIEFYTNEQVKDIVIQDMNDKTIQDYLHVNHIPIKCVYIDNIYTEYVCKKLNIEYRTCFVGFSKSSPVYKGVYIYKKDLFIVSNFVFEYFDYHKKEEMRMKVMNIIKMWTTIVKMCKKYKKISNRLK